MVCVRVAFHENDGNHENDENDEDNSDSYKQGVECWIRGNHGHHGNDENHRNPGCKPRVPQTTGLEIPERRLWLFPGSVRGFSRKTPGKSRENSWKIFPEARNATSSRIWGTGKGKPAGNLGSTLPEPCPDLPCRVFFEIDSSSLLEFF